MYRRDLQKALENKNFPNFFLLYGGDNFQTELYGNFIKQKYGVEENLKLYFEEYDFARASDFLALGSLFSSKKLLEIKCLKKPSTKDLKALISLCKNNADNFFLLELYDENAKQSELEKIFENHFARFFKISNSKEGIELLAMKAKELNVEITHNALITLFVSFDENLYLAASELNKFVDLKVDENIIKQYCYSLALVGFDDFFDKLLKTRNIKEELEKILENFNGIALINSLSSAFYRLFKITIYAKIYGKIDFKDLLGYTPPPQVGQALSGQAFKLDLKQYKAIFNLLLKSEYEIKTNSKLSKKEFLLANLLELQRILK